MNLPISASLARSKSAVYTQIDDQVVMLDAERGEYYELDPIGSRIWMLLEDGQVMEKLRDALTAEYDVDGETCLRDLAGFLGQLSELGLVEVMGVGTEHQ